MDIVLVYRMLSKGGTFASKEKQEALGKWF